MAARGLYSQLINMGFDEESALIAAQKCETVNEAIAWIDKNSKNNISSEIEEMKHTHCDCNGKNVRECIALQRLISVLKNCHNSNKELAKKHSFVLSDWHHLLECYLSADTRVTQKESNAHFAVMNEIVTSETSLICEIEKCNFYERNNRKRETSMDSWTVETDLIDAIHCYLLHSHDLGFRICDYSNNNSEKEMTHLRQCLTLKRDKLRKIRGNQRVAHSKFMTTFTGLNTFVFCLFVCTVF